MTILRLNSVSDSDIDKSAGRLLRQLRRERGLSQTSLGSRVGISFQQIQKYEKGANRISISRLFALCCALDISPLTFVKELSQDPRPLDLVISPKAWRFLETYSNLPMPIQNQLNVLLDAISKDRS